MVNDPLDGPTLEDLNIVATNMSDQSVGPTAHHKTAVTSNTLLVWIVMTVEMWNNSVQPGGRVIRGLHGSSNMPRFDKLIGNLNPTQAVFQHLYHLSELHHLTTTLGEAIMMCFQPDVFSIMTRVATHHLNLFRRAKKTMQVQLEEHCEWFFSATELASQQVWRLTRQQGFNEIFNMLSWSNGCLWSFNTPIMLSSANNIDEPQRYAVNQALRYGGTQQLHFLPQHVRDLVKSFVDEQHPLLTNTEGYNYHGVKTTERLRGSTTLSAYLVECNNATNIAEYLQEMQQYRMNTYAAVANVAQEDNMETTEATG